MTVTNAETMEKFGYAICKRCNGEHLAFSLLEGLCYWCRGVLSREGTR